MDYWLKQGLKCKISSEVILVAQLAYPLLKGKANFPHNMMMQLYLLSVYDVILKQISFFAIWLDAMK